MEIKTHVLTNEQHLDDTRKERARKNIEAIGSIKLNEHDVVKGDVADLSGVVVPTPSAEDHQKVLTAGNDGSFGWNALPEGIAPYDGNPAMDGTASAGSSELFARGDHVHPADTSKANKSEMAITAVSGDTTKKNIQLKNDLRQDVVVEHQDVSGKANASEMAITDVSGDASKKNIQLKNDLSQDVVVAHQDISGKEDNSNKVSAWSETTTDEHYPSEKLVKGSLDQKEDKSNKVTAWSNQPTDTSYPSERLTKESLDTKANKSEMSVTTDGDKTTIILKEGTSATVINAHQNISGKAEKSEMAIDDVVGDNTKKKITLKTGLSQDVVVEHQDISGKADKVNSATSGNFAGLDANGDLTDSGKKAADFATAAQGTKADSAVQSVKMGSSSGAELNNGTNVVIPEATQSAPGVMSTSDKTKLDGIETGANKYIHPSHTEHHSGMYKVTIDAQGHVSDVAAIEKSDITALGIPAQDTTYQFADEYDGTTNKGATEATVRNAVSNAINALDRTEDSTGGTNIEIQIVEENGLIKEIKVVTDNTVNATDVNTAIETALANYGGFKVVELTSDTPPVPDVQNPSEKYIYLTKDSQSSARDPYTEWIYIKGDESADPPTQSHWEVIGETSVDLSNYIQKLSNATTGNLVKVKADGSIEDAGAKVSDFATAAQGAKAESSVQSVSINNGTEIAPDSNGKVNLPIASTTDPGAMSASDKSKLDGITNYIESATVTGRTLTLNPKSGQSVTFNDTGDINVIEKIAVNGTQQTVTNKEVDLTIPAAANNAKITLKVDGAAAGDTTPVAGDFTVDQSLDKDIVIPAAVSASGNDPAKPGVMSAADKTKLDGIANGAEVNSIESITIEGDQNPLPISSENVTIPKAAYTTGGDPSYTTGAVTGQDKKKLDEIEPGAQVNDIEHIKIEGESADLTIDLNKRIELPLATSATTSPVAPAKPGIMSATDKKKLDDLESVYLDATAYSAIPSGYDSVDHYLMTGPGENCCPQSSRENEYKTYYIKETIILDPNAPQPETADRYNVYKWVSDKVPEKSGSWPETSQYECVDAATYTAAEISALMTEEVADAVDTLKSRIIYSMSPASVNGGTQISVQGAHTQPEYFFTLVSPNMNMFIDTDTMVAWCSNQMNHTTTSTEYVYIVIYEVDFSLNLIRWVANTDNIIANFTSTGLHHAKLHNFAVTAPNGKGELRSDKLYYVGVLLNVPTSLQFTGNGAYSNTNLTPTVVRRMQSNFTQDAMYDADAIQTTDYSFALSNGSEGQVKPIFFAITNLVLSGGVTITSQEPFVMIAGYTNNIRNIAHFVDSTTTVDSVFQTVQPSKNCTVTSWSIIDNHSTVSSHSIIGKVLRDLSLSGGNDWEVHVDNDGNAGSISTEALNGELTGYYKHTYTPTTPVSLDANIYYQFPCTTAVSNDHSDALIQYSAGLIRRRICFWNGANPNAVENVLGCYLHLVCSYNGQTIIGDA